MIGHDDAAPYPSSPLNGNEVFCQVWEGEPNFPQDSTIQAVRDFLSKSRDVSLCPSQHRGRMVSDGTSKKGGARFKCKFVQDNGKNCNATCSMEAMKCWIRLGDNAFLRHVTTTREVRGLTVGSGQPTTTASTASPRTMVTRALAKAATPPTPVLITSRFQVLETLQDEDVFHDASNAIRSDVSNGTPYSSGARIPSPSMVDTPTMDMVSELADIKFMLKKLVERQRQIEELLLLVEQTEKQETGQQVPPPTTQESSSMAEGSTDRQAQSKPPAKQKTKVPKKNTPTSINPSTPSKGLPQSSVNVAVKSYAEAAKTNAADLKKASEALINALVVKKNTPSVPRIQRAAAATIPPSQLCRVYVGDIARAPLGTVRRALEGLAGLQKGDVVNVSFVTSTILEVVVKETSKESLVDAIAAVSATVLDRYQAHIPLDPRADSVLKNKFLQTAIARWEHIAKTTSNSSAQDYFCNLVESLKPFPADGSSPVTGTQATQPSEPSAGESSNAPVALTQC